MSSEEFDGVLELSRIAEGIKQSKSDLELFTDHNKQMDKVMRKLEDAIYWISSLYAYEFGVTRGSLVAESFEKASNLPYNVRSPQNLYLTWVNIQRSLINDLNAFSEDASDKEKNELIEAAWFALDRLETQMDKYYAKKR